MKHPQKLKDPQTPTSRSPTSPSAATHIRNRTTNPIMYSPAPFHLLTTNSCLQPPHAHFHFLKSWNNLRKIKIIKTPSPTKPEIWLGILTLSLGL